MQEEPRWVSESHKLDVVGLTPTPATNVPTRVGDAPDRFSQNPSMGGGWNLNKPMFRRGPPNDGGTIGALVFYEKKGVFY